MDISLGLLIGRIVVGLTMSAHGAQKLFGWFGGYGIAGTAQFFDSVGFRPGRVMAIVAGLSEVTSGLLVALGLFGPIGPALMLAVMITASSIHWKNGFFVANNGIEVPLLYGGAALALAFAGYGALSLDAFFGAASFWTLDLIVAAVAVGVLGGIGNLVMRSLATHRVVNA